MEVEHKHLRALLGQFYWTKHGARRWTNWRACFAMYLDYRIVEFFLSFRLREPTDKAGNSKFVPREREEMVKIWDEYFECIKELHIRPTL